jgi:hypothetical protein
MLEEGMVVAASFRKFNQTGHQFSGMNHHMSFDTTFASAVFSRSSGFFKDILE